MKGLTHCIHISICSLKCLIELYILQINITGHLFINRYYVASFLSTPLLTSSLSAVNKNETERCLSYRLAVSNSHNYVALDPVIPELFCLTKV